MKIFLGILISFICTVYVFNTYVDVAGQQAGEVVYSLSQQQEVNQVLVWDRLFDQRIWLKSRIDAARRNSCPDVLILSSSTLGGISNSSFPGRKILNGWMGAPSIEDYEAITHLIEQGNCPHLEIWIGMDPWFFNREEKSDRWTSLINPFNAYQIDHGELSRSIRGYLSFWSRIKDRMSFITTRESLLYFTAHANDVIKMDKPELRATGKPLDIACSDAKTELYLRAQDGHFFGCPRFALSQEQISYLSKTYLERNAHGVREWKQIDTETLLRLSKMMNVLTNHGHKLVLIAPVYHPLTYQSLMENEHVRSNLALLDTQLTKLASQYGTRFINLRDPSTSGCIAQEFEDSHHAGPSCLEKEVMAITTSSRTDSVPPPKKSAERP